MMAAEKNSRSKKLEGQFATNLAGTLWKARYECDHGQLNYNSVPKDQNAKLGVLTFQSLTGSQPGTC